VAESGICPWQLAYARLNNGTRVVDVADLRKYIYEQRGRIRTTGLNDNGRGQVISKSYG
jgi:hypothetical protein